MRVKSVHEGEPEVTDLDRLSGCLDRLLPHVRLESVAITGGVGVAPEAVAPPVYGGEGDWCCQRCGLSSHPDWPLAAKDRVFELLGWTR